ncbi:MAG: aspartyl protease family protein [Caulobacteraceae bacterium]
MRPLRWRVLWVALGALWFTGAGEASAECYGAEQIEPGPTPAIPGVTEAAGPLARDRGGRMIAPMMVNGRGPFRFIVDTGANRSALSQSLADRLGLSVVGTGNVHSIHGVTTAPLVEVDSLHYGDLHLGAATLPILTGAVLAGQEGLLGVDGMRGRRLRIDFEHRCIEITASSGTLRRRGWTSVRGELRFGHLVVIEGRIRGERVNVLVDTGSDSTLANIALREQLRSAIRIDHRSMDYARAYTAGTPIVLDSAILLPRFTMGDVEARNITAFVGDFHIFRLWGFVDQPALLIGMNVLSQTRAIAIDYDHATVYFRLTQEPRTGSRLSGANRAAGVTIGN